MIKFKRFNNLSKANQELVIISISIRDIYRNTESLLNGILKKQYFNNDFLDDIQEKITNIISESEMKPYIEFQNKINIKEIIIDSIVNQSDLKINFNIDEIYNLLKYGIDKTDNFILNNKNNKIKALYKEYSTTHDSIMNLLNELKNNSLSKTIK